MMGKNHLRALLEPYKVSSNIVDDHNVVSLSPCERGFGMTIGNSLRRVLLSCIEGCAVSCIQIQGVSHEFSGVDNLQEDIMELVCNIKDLRFTNIDNEPVLIRLECNGVGRFDSSALVLPHGVECITPNVYICELTEDVSFNIFMLIKKDRGYVEENKEDASYFPMPNGCVGIANNYSAVKRVSFKVEDAQMIDNQPSENVILEVDTDGSISANDAIKESALILCRQFSRICGGFESADMIPVNDMSKSDSGENAELALYEKLVKGIDHLELTVRSSNCLLGAEIYNVFGLVTMTSDSLLKLPNFGRKSLNEVQAIMESMSLQLGMAIPQNVHKMIVKAMEQSSENNKAIAANNANVGTFTSSSSVFDKSGVINPDHLNEKIGLKINDDNDKINESETSDDLLVSNDDVEFEEDK